MMHLPCVGIGERLRRGIQGRGKPPGITDKPEKLRVTRRPFDVSGLQKRPDVASQATLRVFFRAVGKGHEQIVNAP